jgi:hypothetical protein
MIAKYLDPDAVELRQIRIRLHTDPMIMCLAIKTIKEYVPRCIVLVWIGNGIDFNTARTMQGLS